MIRGAVFLTGRSIVAMAIGLISLLLLTREIGPVAFGIYVSAVGIVRYLAQLATLGLDVYLIRRSEEPDPALYGQALTLLVCSSLVAVAIGAAALPALESWLGSSQFVGPYLVLLAALPLINLSLPAIARLERSLDYRAVALIHVGGQAVFAIVSLPLAFAGAGVWAAVAGFIAWQTFQVTISWIVAPVFPGLSWAPALVREALGYGIGYSASMWIWQLRNLVNPLIVGGLLGPQAVALVGLAVRIVQALSFVRRAVWRLALVGMAKVQDDNARSTRMVNEAMLLQTLTVGPLFAGFALVGPFVFPLFYGPEWDNLFLVFPLIALASLVNGVFNMHTSQLQVRGHNGEVAIFHAVHVAIFAGSAFLLLERFGLIGYGLAEVAALVSYWVVHRYLIRFVQPAYGETFLWLAAGIPPLFSSQVGLQLQPLLWLPLIVMALLPSTRRRLKKYLGQLASKPSTDSDFSK